MTCILSSFHPWFAAVTNFHSVCVLNTQGDGFLRAIKICSTSSSRMGSKAGRSKDFTACKRTLEPTGMNRQNFSFPLSHP
jgi:hypothetical protein